MVPYEALCRRNAELQKIFGIDLIRETEDKVGIIRDCLKSVPDHHKLYTGLKIKYIEFQIDEKKKVLHFDRKGKLSPRFIGTYKVIERIGPVAYRLALLTELEKIHSVLVSMLRLHMSDPSHPDMTYNEELVQILAWECHGVEDATWEPEETMKLKYLNLFSHKIFEGKNSFIGGEL
ncbi:pol protein [Gossypium australe]|uniref:Pol protein n=1 Tax=Gossypium australe TaxID=47621 RepID=A0A5B6VNL4_9ROSI|nr:pol protein [Gossypium australe]